MRAYSIKYYKEKEIILVGGCFQDNRDFVSTIKLYRSVNFELINSINYVNGQLTEGIEILKNGLIATYGYDYDYENNIVIYPIKILSLEKFYKKYNYCQSTSDP